MIQYDTWGKHGVRDQQQKMTNLGGASWEKQGGGKTCTGEEGPTAVDFALPNAPSHVCAIVHIIRVQQLPLEQTTKSFAGVVSIKQYPTPKCKIHHSRNTDNEVGYTQDRHQ